VGAETEAYYRRQNVKQRRSRIPLTPQTIPPNATLDLPAVRINEALADVTAMLNDPALQFSGLSSAEQSTVGNFVPEPTSMALLAITGLLLASRR